MENSPKGREIIVVTGDADRIKTRGEEIKDLGAQMIGAAGVLKAMADGSDGQEGLSIEKIREVVGDIHVELKLAGERYEPTGQAMITYGNALETAKTDLQVHVTNCTTYWSEVLQARGALWDVQTSAPLGSPFLVTPEQEDAQEQHEQDLTDARSAASEAYTTWQGEAVLFDDDYDTWRAAFDAAADSIEDATDGGVSDGFWDNVDGIVDDVLVVLQYVGIALAILAFVVGGPIIAALGAIVALATFALTMYKAGRGNASGWEIAFAIIGIIPFGSLAKFAGGAKAGTLGMLDDMVGGLGTSAGRANVFGAIGDIPTNWASAGAAGSNFFGRFSSAAGGSSSLDDIAARLMGFNTARESADALTTGNGGWGVAAHVFGHYGWVVNSPGQLAQVGIGALLENRRTSTVDTWEAQLAAS